MFGQALPDYELFIYALQDNYSIIQTSTLAVIRQANNVATVEGELFFPNDYRMRVMEFVRFDLTPPQLTRYGYELDF